MDKKEQTGKNWEEKAKNLPARPGVYIFKDKNEKVLYVGKAKSLSARVRSYTRDAGDGRAHIVFLRKRIDGLDFIVTDSEKEALILENNLIKKHRPRYNIRLRDDKTYYSIRLTMSEKFPRLLLARRPKKGGKDIVFGPFSSSGAVKETMRTLQEIFPLRRCQKRFRYRDRACLNYQIGKCPGPCVKNISETEYKQVAEQVLKFLKGKKPELVVSLKEEMIAASQAENFEKAASIRDRIQDIEKTLEKQKVDSSKPMDRDIIGFCSEGDRVVVHRLGYRGGVLLVSVPHSFSRVNLPDDEVLSSFISQLYPERGQPPDEMLVPFYPDSLDIILESLSDIRGKKCVIRVPERGEGKQLVEMASQNAKEALKRDADRAQDRERAMEELKGKLRLKKTPRWIECVDISILAGEAAVGSIVKFQNGDPDKKGYRRYKIKNVSGVNDYDMMKEVLERRFGRALKEGLDMPDLLVVDGGKGQLNVALAVLDSLNIKDIFVIGLAKDREMGGPLSAEVIKKGERVFMPGRKDHVAIKQGTAGLFLLQRARDEAHRFAVSYHKLLRGKKTSHSVLEKIPGIGPKKARSVLKEFGGVKKISLMEAKEIANAPGIGLKDAEKIKAYLDEN